MNLLAIDAGTTHCKVGLFAADGTALALASRPMATRPMPRLSPHAAEGSACFDPEELWAAVAGALAEVTARSTKGKEPGRAAAVGISSMAETGLLLDRRSGRPRTPFLPWFDTGAAAQAARIASQSDTAERFRRTGLRMSHKSGLAKLLWLRDELGVDLSGCTWLSVADYLAYRLTGQMATDPTLAARTHAFRLDLQAWDEEWLQHWDLGPGLFPPVLPSGAVTGRVAAGISGLAGLAAGTPVIIAGHDHVCAAFAAGATRPGWVMDSMGTAEVLLGALEMPAGRVEEQPLDRAQLDSGLLYGPHVVPGHRIWLGSLSLSGGAVEWLRGVLDRDRMSYGELEALIAGGGPQPTGILFFPHLAGKGLRGAGGSGAAFLGLRLGHTRADLGRAVLEGTAYEIERLRRTAKAAHGTPIDKLVAVGGGTRLASWLQVKADVSGVPIEVPPQREAALLGAALLAGLTAGLPHDAAVRWGGTAVERYTPNAERHAQYREVFEDQYLPFARAPVTNHDV